MTPRVLLVDDGTVLSQALAEALPLYGIGEVKRVRPAELEIEASARVPAWRPSVVIVDPFLGDGSAPEHLLSNLSATGATVIVLTASADRMEWARALELGAVGILSKTVDFHELVVALHRAAAGLPMLDSSEREALLAELARTRRADEKRGERFKRLTPREQQVLAALIDGQATDQIARDLHMSVPTIRTHIRSMFDKLGVNRQRAAVALAIAAGWKPDAA